MQYLDYHYARPEAMAASTRPCPTTQQSATYPTEVGLLSRNIVFEAASDDVVQTDGGHLTIFHTGGGTAQKLEGVELRRFGQQGMVGRYVSKHLDQHFLCIVLTRTYYLLSTYFPS